MMAKRLLRSERGAGAVEFALAAPVLLSMVIGVSQLGILFAANSGMQHAIEEAARVAAVYPTPDDVEAQVRAAVQAERFGLKGTLTPTVVPGESEDDMPVLDISLSYAVPLDFIFFQTPPVTLTHSRRVFLQQAPGAEEEEEEEAPVDESEGGATSAGGNSNGGTDSSGGAGTSSGAGTTTGGTTTGGTTTGGTTTGGTTTGGTTTTTTGGTTTTTTGGTTTTTTGGTTTTSTGGGTSNGNSNGNASSGNGNGGGKKK